MELFQLEATDTSWLSDGTDPQLSAHKKHRGKERRNVTRNLQSKPSDVDEEKLIATVGCQK